MNTREKLSWTLLGAAVFFGIAAVSTDTSFFKNASLTGWLSLSGETNRLTVAGDALLLDGSAIGGGGESLWTTNSDGWITPAGGEYLTNTLVFKSGLADDGTNVAAVVDTDEAWTSGRLLSFRNDGSEQRWVAKNGAIAGGTRLEDILNYPPNGKLAYIANDVSQGEGPGWGYKLGTWADAFNGDYGFSTLSGDEDDAYLDIAAQDGTRAYSIVLQLEPASTNALFRITDDFQGVDLVRLHPSSAANTTPHLFDTLSARASGRLVDVANLGTNAFQIHHNGAVSNGGDTNRWIFKGVSGGNATININGSDYTFSVTGP